MQEIIVDSFAGGGGASAGIEAALGRSPDVAINHDPEALAMHAVNHPLTRHLASNIWRVHPDSVMPGRPIGLMWASPDCKHHSKAKGGKPREKSIRDLAWVVVLWARRRAPRVIILENVEEFRHWGPLDWSDMPVAERSGETFREFVGALRRLGYRVEWRLLRACDFGAPTIRRRLYLIARRDGRPIVWPEPTHGDPGSAEVVSGRREAWRTAAEVIDWSLPCPSIFLTREEGRAIGVNRPLAEATMARIAKGVRRYVIDAAEPFIVPITHTGSDRVNPIGEPLRAVTTAHRGEYAVVSPYLVPRYGERPGQEPRTRSVEEPLPVVVPTANGGSFAAVYMAQHYTGQTGREADEPLSTIVHRGTQQAIAAAFLAQHNTDMVGHRAEAPVSTIVGKGCTQAVVASILSHAYGSNTAGGQGDPRQPIKTVTTGGHAMEVRAFLVKYYGTDQDPHLEEPLHTATTKARFGLVHVHGEPYQIVDIGMRMLTPRELFRAQGFPDGYVIDRGADGTPLTKTAQIRMCGNSVCPPVAAALVAANYRPDEASEVAGRRRAERSDFGQSLLEAVP